MSFLSGDLVIVTQRKCSDRFLLKDVLTLTYNICNTVCNNDKNCFITVLEKKDYNKHLIAFVSW